MSDTLTDILAGMMADYIGRNKTTQAWCADYAEAVSPAFRELVEALRDIHRTCPRNSTDPAAKRYFQWVSDQARDAISKYTESGT